jgi:hypothetical protein
MLQAPKDPTAEPESRTVEGSAEAHQDPHDPHFRVEVASAGSTTTNDPSGTDKGP